YRAGAAAGAGRCRDVEYVVAGRRVVRLGDLGTSGRADTYRWTVPGAGHCLHGSGCRGVVHGHPAGRLRRAGHPVVTRNSVVPDAERVVAPPSPGKGSL